MESAVLDQHLRLLTGTLKHPSNPSTSTCASVAGSSLVDAQTSIHTHIGQNSAALGQSAALGTACRTREEKVRLGPKPSSPSISVLPRLIPWRKALMVLRHHRAINFEALG